MPLIHYEAILICSASCVIFATTRATTFTVTDKTLYVPVVTLSTQNCVKLLQQIKSGFKKLTGININQKYRHYLKSSY